MLKLPGRLVFGDEPNTFLADPDEVIEVSFDSCPGIIKKYQQLEDFHWCIRPLSIAFSLLTAAKLGVSVGKCINAKLKKDSKDHRTKDGEVGGKPAWLRPNILFKEGTFIFLQYFALLRILGEHLVAELVRKKRSESYRYYDLPFCIPDHVKLEEKKEDLREVLNGDRLVSGPYALDFLVDKDSEMLCRKKLTKDEVAQFRRAVDKDYYFEMYYDELPVWGLIGRVENREETEDTTYYKYLLYKYIHFDIHYNMDRVIEITARMDPHSILDLTEDREVDVEFTYTAKWKGTDILFENRMDKFM
ncbi:hypothetical protein RDI58_000662 [Solanum bulbocastanum]|uniref:Transmembrane 9 superfamily member n=1 Tax=Solanum bulbocastanum TaxID=147425 RepID=A0AAN8U7V1_SOLBU